MKNLFLLIALFFLFQKISYSQAGKLDSSFGTNGVAKNDLGSPYDYGTVELRQIVVRPDGNYHILFQRSGTVFFAKRNENGLVDFNFGENGASSMISIRDPYLAIQSDSKVVIAGTTTGSRSDFEIYRFNIDGSLDKSFSNDGEQAIYFDNDAYLTAVAVQDNGKITVAGYTTTVDETGQNSYDFALARLNTDGTKDSSFSDDGKQVTHVSYDDDVPTSIVTGEDEKIIVVGHSDVNDRSGKYSYSAIVRYNKDGSLDNSFYADPTSFGFNSLFPESVVFQKDGKIVITGRCDILTGVDDETTASDIFVARYNINGKLDSTFNNTGLETVDLGSDNDDAKMVKLQNDGKIIVLGNGSSGGAADFAIARFNTNGNLDRTFGTDGLKRTHFANGDDNANLLYIKSDGKIVAAGTSGNATSLALAHYNSDGSMDTSFYAIGKTTKPFRAFAQGSSAFTSTALQPDGKMIAAGRTYNGNNYDFVVVRYNTDGNLDSTFSNDGVQTADFGSFVDAATSVAIQTDGKIVAGGYTSDQDGNHFALARYNTTGSADSSFGTNGMQKNLKELGRASSLAIQSDGKILLAGNLWNGSNNDFGIMRYTANGSPDSTFGVFGILKNDFGATEDNAAAMALQSDGKIVVTGIANDYQNNTFVLIRYNANGTKDSSFEEKIYPVGNNQVNAIAIQGDGKIVVGGLNSSNDENNQPVTDFAFARFNTDGTFDTKFGNNGIVLLPASKDALINSLVVQRNGKIIGGGVNQNSICLVRLLNADGALDKSFNSKGIETLQLGISSQTSVRGMAMYNNKLYVAGFGRFPGTLAVAARFLLDDTLLSPIVSIISPVNDTVYSIPANIKIKAEASDADGIVTKVEFFNGKTLLATQTIKPYGYLWNNAPAGNYTLTAVATDNNGNTTVSDTVKVSVIPHHAPTVSLINPVNNDIFSGPTTIHLRASAIDPEGTISKVEFYNGTTLMRTEHTYPYTYTWINVPVGKYTLTAVATNNFGLETTSAAVHISVIANKKPTVSIANIANYQSFAAPAAIPIIANAKDPDGTISKVEFYNGTALLATQYWSPYASTWKDVPAGTYTITAKATDNLGLSATSAPVTIIVTAQNVPVVSSRPFSADNKTDISGVISLKAWPNPAGNTLIVYANGLPQNKRATISVISALGIVMKTMQSSDLNAAVQIDVSSFTSGMYTVKVACENKVLNKQFMKL